MDPIENLINYITRDNILFSLVQGVIIIPALFSVILRFGKKRTNNSTPAGNPPSGGSVTSNQLHSFQKTLYLGSLVFFVAVCFSNEEIIGHRIFWLSLDFGLLTYLFFFSKRS